MAINVLLLAAGGLAFVLLGDSWWQLLTAMFIVLSPLQAVLFILVHQGMMGVYLGCSFAPNHKGMPILTRDEQLDHLRKQAFCARHGISYRQCGLFTSYAQILRHLHDVGAALRHPSRLANATS